MFQPNAGVVLPPAPPHGQGHGARQPISPFSDKFVNVTSDLNQDDHEKNIDTLKPEDNVKIQIQRTYGKREALSWFILHKIVLFPAKEATPYFVLRSIDGGDKRLSLCMHLSLKIPLWKKMIQVWKQHSTYKN